MEEREHNEEEVGPQSVTPQPADGELPLGVRVAAAWSWRLIVIGLAFAGFLWLVVQVRIIVIPILIAILLTALLAPVVQWFERNYLPRWAGVIVALAAFVGAVWLLVSLIVTQLRSGFDEVIVRSEVSTLR